MSMRLYEIAEQYKFLLDGMIDNETGEVDETKMSLLDEVADSFENKCLNVTRVFKQLEVDLAGIEKERKAMAAREKSLKNEVTRLKSYLLENMEKTGIKAISCPQFAINLVKNPCSVDIYDADEIPEEYTQTKVEISKEAIKLAIKGGIEVPGARLVQINRISIK